jgi:hypothetical protein
MVGLFEVASKLTLRYVNCWLLWGYTESGRVQSPRRDPPLPWGIVVRSAYGDHFSVCQSIREVDMGRFVAQKQENL